MPFGNVKLFNKIAPIEDVKKVFTAGGANSDLLTGGSLNEEQQLEVMNFIRAYTVMLAPHLGDLANYPKESPIGRGYQARTSGMSSVGSVPALVPGDCTMMHHGAGTVSGTYDQLHVGRPITRGATEATQDADQYTRNPAAFGRRRWGADKLRSSWSSSTEFFERNIRRGQLNQELAKALAPRMGQDFEDLAINGDTTTTDPSERGDLLKVHDGWVKQTREQCYKISAGGDIIEHALFMAALKSMPAEYSVQDHKWWMHPWVWHDYIELLQARTSGGPAADNALAGVGVSPYGFSVALVPTLPRDDALQVDDLATAARAKNTAIGPFALKAGANTININIDVAGATAIALPTENDSNVQDRLLTVSRIAAIINEEYSDDWGVVYSNIAREGQHGTLEIISPTTGAASHVNILAGTANVALGLTIADTQGVDAGGAGIYNTMHEGTMMWLSPAWNFVWHVVTGGDYNSSNGLRMYTKFDQGSDSVLTDIYSHQGASIMAPQACIVMDNLRTLRANSPVVVP